MYFYVFFMLKMLLDVTVIFAIDSVLAEAFSSK